MYLDPQITTAHEDLYHADLDACYSSVARHGKEKLLGAAREGMRSARGRTALIHPDISIDFALLPGALALLEQGGHYDLVIQLAQQAQRVTARDLRTKNRSTVRDYERDVALATALAHCGLAKQALESGQTALGCARLEEALHILRETSSGGALAPELQANIATALADLKADAVLEYLTEPLDLAQVTLRQQAVAVLASMLQRPASVTSASGTSPITAEYAGRALANLTADEVCRLLDWDKAVSARAACPWWFQSLLPKVGLAHLVAGFMQRRPALVATAQRLLSAGTADGDVAVHLAVCELLLGRPMEALDVLKEDERSAAKSRGPRALSPSLPKTAFRNGAVPPFPDRDGVMAFIRVASPGGEADLLPGLCLFAEQWLQRVAFPQIRDTAERPPSATLASYFEDPQTEAFLESRDAGLPFLRRLQALVSAAGHTAASSSGRLAREVVEVASLPVKGLAAVQAALGSTWVRGLLGAAALVALIGIGMGQLGTQRRHAAQSPGGAAAAASFAAPATQRVGRQAQGKQISLAKGDAQDLVQQWLVRTSFIYKKLII